MSQTTQLIATPVLSVPPEPPPPPEPPLPPPEQPRPQPEPVVLPQ